ncbi:hypothetical protein BT96DRAFT_1091206, partial [Gymnopus androsaceus JB14]
TAVRRCCCSRRCDYSIHWSRAQHEYLFGLFLEGSEDNSTQLIGTPSTVTVQSAVVEPPVTAISYIAKMVFPTISMTAPLQIDMFLTYNDNVKIASYDAILHCIAKELNVTMMNITEIIQLKTATDVCAVSMQYCTGDNQQYKSHEACISFMTELPFGETWQGGMNTGWCWYIHRNMVKYCPEVHCPHIGPNGGEMCIAHTSRSSTPIRSTRPFLYTTLPTMLPT